MKLKTALVMLRFELLQYARTPMVSVLLVLGPLLSVLSILLSVNRHPITTSDRVYNVVVFGASHIVVDRANEILAHWAAIDSTSLRLTVLPAEDPAALSMILEHSMSGPQGKESTVGTSTPLQVNGLGTEELLQSDALYLLDTARGEHSLRVLRPHDGASFLDEYLRSVMMQALDGKLLSSEPQLALRESKVIDKHSSTTIIGLVAAVSTLILFMSMVGSASQLLLRSLFEERSTSVLDVLLSSSSPSQVLSVKFTAVLVLGLIQSLVWVVAMALSGTAAAIQAASGGLALMAGSAFASFSVWSALALLAAARLEREGTAHALSAFVGLLAIVPMMAILQSSGSAAVATDLICRIAPMYSAVYTAARMAYEHGASQSTMVLPLLSSLVTTVFVVLVSTQLFRKKIQSRSFASAHERRNRI